MRPYESWFLTVSLWRKLFRLSPPFLHTMKKEQNIVMEVMLHMNVMQNGLLYLKMT